MCLSRSFHSKFETDLEKAERKKNIWLNVEVKRSNKEFLGNSGTPRTGLDSAGWYFILSKQRCAR